MPNEEVVAVELEKMFTNNTAVVYMRKLVLRCLQAAYRNAKQCEVHLSEIERSHTLRGILSLSRAVLNGVDYGSRKLRLTDYKRRYLLLTARALTKNIAVLW